MSKARSRRAVALKNTNFFRIPGLSAPLIIGKITILDKVHQGHLGISAHERMV